MNFDSIVGLNSILGTSCKKGVLLRKILDWGFFIYVDVGQNTAMSVVNVEKIMCDWAFCVIRNQ